MSITFTITNNVPYSNANGLTTYTVYDCQCMDYPEGCAGCHYCKGTGKESFPCYPFDMNVANGNAYPLLRLLKMGEEPCGECNPQVILDGINFVRAIQTAGCSPLVTDDTTDIGSKGCRVYNMGRSEEQVERYLDTLYAIAMEAARRKTTVVWY